MNDYHEVCMEARLPTCASVDLPPPGGEPPPEPGRGRLLIGIVENTPFSSDGPEPGKPYDVWLTCTTDEDGYDHSEVIYRNSHLTEIEAVEEADKLGERYLNATFDIVTGQAIEDKYEDEHRLEHSLL